VTRVFVVNHYPVLPAANGGQHTVHAMARELSLAWPTQLVWTERKTDLARQVDEGDRRFELQVLPNRWLQRKVVRALRPAFGAVESDIGSQLFSGGNRRLVDHLVSASRDGDVFMLCHPWLWPALRQVLAQRQATLVYDAHNVEYVLKQQSLKPGVISRWAVEHLRRLEAELVRRADRVLACTPLDARTLAELSGRPPDQFMVGLRGVQPSKRADAVAAARAGRPPARVAVFMGSKHVPNDLAARWIIESLAPACPDWRFDIAGACGPAAGVAPGPNVRVLGHVADLSSLLAEAGVALNPITLGSGVNMKLFEYLQHGLPAISTAFGTRGLEGGERHGIVITETDGFAAALQALGADAPRALALGREGAAWVQQRFTWPAVGARLRAELQGLLAAAPAR
jgi:glycosyltransferase involved in cell wall biosynthesis